MLTFAWTAALSFSPLPLRVSLLLGILTALIGFCAGIYALVVAFIHFFFADVGIPYSSGWASIMTLLCLVGGAILVGIGILGEYVARIYDEIKARPLYLVSYRRNVEHSTHPL
jgi:dolichol-phosphate mannosyltransferase